ncbi:MAG: toprim domain-containing protein, partial [bacterium]|nr:toprim domain-containing protein [bacterium]
KGLYHVLHGAINPLENIGPEEIYISDLVKRVKGYENGDGKELEIILATNPTMEGNATAMYVMSQVKAQNHDCTVTRLGLGLPTGADLEYADDTTLTQAIEGRRSF